MSLSEIQNFVKDKNVLLVGNSVAALDRVQGELIDSYDIVVRFGKGMPHGKEKSIGAKTDIWVTGGFRSGMRNLLPDEVKVLFSASTANNSAVPEIGYEHTLMYTPEEIQNINTVLGQTNNKRLSTGALAAYYFKHEVKTYRSLTFINFDMFSISTKFIAKQHNKVEWASSWHLPIPTPTKATNTEHEHPAHNIDVEKRLVQNILKDDNAFFIGEFPKDAKVIDVVNASWDNIRIKL